MENDASNARLMDRLMARRGQVRLRVGLAPRVSALQDRQHLWVAINGGFHMATDNGAPERLVGSGLDVVGPVGVCPLTCGGPGPGTAWRAA